jgi:hypothetical protein
MLVKRGRENLDPFDLILNISKDVIQDNCPCNLIFNLSRIGQSSLEINGQLIGSIPKSIAGAYQVFGLHLSRCQHHPLPVHMLQNPFPFPYLQLSVYPISLYGQKVI